MEVKLTLENLEPYSLNNLYYATKAHGWTAAAKAWASQVCLQLSSVANQEAINAFKAMYEPGTPVSIEIAFYMPVLAKNGLISKTSKDLDNILKPLIDILCSKAFNGSDTYKCFNFYPEVNDAFITKLTTEKIHSDIPKIEITMKHKETF